MLNVLWRMIISLKYLFLLLVLLAVATVSTKGKLVAFWHIFHGGAYQNITTEQVHALNRSGLLPLLDKIYYTVSGSEVHEDFSFSRNEKFQKLKHHGKRSAIIYYIPQPNFVFLQTNPDFRFFRGNELHTLRLLYDHCSNVDNFDDKVLYFHNKGSFHTSEGNTHLRQLLGMRCMRLH